MSHEDQSHCGEGNETLTLSGGGAAGDTWGREGDVDMAEVTWLQASSAPGRIWNHGIDT